MDDKKTRKCGKCAGVGKEQKRLQKYYIVLQNCFKNISKIFQIVLTIVLKCNIYNTKENTNKMEELSWQ